MIEAFSDARIDVGMRAQMKLRQQQFDGGAKQIGWKVGFGAPAAKEKLRIRMPLVGYLLDRAELESGATVPVGGWLRPAAEAEIAAYIGRDLPAQANRETVRSAICAIGPAIELADVNCPMEDVEGILAGDIFQRHVIFGPRDIMRAGGRIEGLRARVDQGGRDIVAPADLEANIGHIPEIVRHVADVAAALGDGLRAGQVIICGSLTAPMFLAIGDSGVDFALDPIGAISARFSW